MQGLFFDTDTEVRIVLRVLVMLIGFWTAWRTGRAVAEGWQTYSRVVVYTLLIAAGMQFLHHALFNGNAIDPGLYLLDLVTLLVFSSLGFRLRRTQQMVTSYYWLYQQTSPVSWKTKD
ncbi:hypothetical protein NAC44_01505 [Allorhizobium sp. BGMRC 0089]|uniref:DUF6867 family protein n=1 Tax=Allorhizobium sonneratiae TaxID=2934936 RepID=UPI00203334EE|nr:hypothetical protein [Allorhizobium sonneratiae]MCM2291002.1 hypothetical protein [Allorhizobium sonneratiae]